MVYSVAEESTLLKSSRHTCGSSTSKCELMYHSEQSTDMERHPRTVAKISKEMAASNQDWRCGSSLRSLPSCAPGEISGLDAVLPIDGLTLTGWVKSNVTMETLVKKTCKYGLVPTVVVASENSTVTDFAITTSASSSFGYGAFGCTICATEIVLGNGEVVYTKVVDRSARGLFLKSDGGLHSPSLVAMPDIPLITASPYVELNYWPICSTPETLETLQILQSDFSINFLEGIVFTSSSSVVIAGRFSPYTGGAIEAQYPGQNGFSQHARSIWSAYMVTGEPLTELRRLLSCTRMPRCILSALSQQRDRVHQKEDHITEAQP